MKNDQFERAKIIKTEIEESNSVLATIRESSGKCFICRDADCTAGDRVVYQFPDYCLQYIIDGLYVKIGRLNQEFEKL